MNVLNKVAWKAMWENKTRTIVTIIGIILSAAMFTAVTTLGYSVWSYLVDIRIGETGDYFLRYDYATDADRDRIAQRDGIRNLGDLRILGYTTFELEDDGHVDRDVAAIAAGDEAFFDMVTVNLEEGRLPQNSSEIVITRKIYDYLCESGISAEVGDSLTLQASAKCPEEVEIKIPEDGTDFEKTYTIVGISERYTKLDDFTVNVSHLFTYADENTESAVWHRIFIKTYLPHTAEKMVKNTPEGVLSALNYELVALYGGTMFNNIAFMLLILCILLIAIIMVGSVSLIYNAFSISVSERSKQFGLLSSIGATKKQIRALVRFEAFALSAIAIPIGILCGYFGIYVTMTLLQSVLSSLFSGYGVVLHATASVFAFACAGIICLVTVLISAGKPAKRATKVSPLTAIRQTQDIQMPKKLKKTAIGSRKISYWMAKKYYTVSKKKYRATVVSLVISVTLFLTAFTFGQTLSAAADSSINTQNFDIVIHNYSENDIFEQIRQQGFVTDSAIWNPGISYYVSIPRSDQNPEYWEICEKMMDPQEGMMMPSFSMRNKTLRIVYLEDAVLRDYLQAQGIDPTPYFDEQCPTALILQSKFAYYGVTEEEEYIRKSVVVDALADGVTELALYPIGLPSEVQVYMKEYFGGGSLSIDQTTEDIVGFDVRLIDYGISSDLIVGTTEDMRTIECVRQVDAQGNVSFAYYFYDTETKTRAEEPIFVEEATQDLLNFKVGATVSEMPYGIQTSYFSDYSRVTAILPLSATTGGNSDKLSVSVSDHNAFLIYASENKLSCSDYLSQEQDYRDLKTLVDVFSYGFIVLITLICVANVFNTISTNIALRRRDFGMLRSIGMTAEDIRGMMVHECLIYGLRALMWGLPIGIALSFGIQKVFYGTLGGKFTFPYGAVLVAAICVFVVVFASMFYAVTKLRKDNPIDAIRAENT